MQTSGPNHPGDAGSSIAGDSNINLGILGLRIRQIVTSNLAITPAVSEFTRQTLDFALDKDSIMIKNWQKAKVQFEDYLHKMELGKVEPEPRFGVLYENLRFAFNCQRKVASTITEHSLANWKEFIEAMEGHTCREIIVSIANVLKVDKDSELLLNLVDNFLLMEFAIIGVLIMREDNSRISDNSISKLERIIAEAAQNYLGTAIEMGFIKIKNINVEPSADTQYDKHFLEEQKYLAECGLKDYIKHLE